MSNIIKHISFIMDGNNRWSKKNSFKNIEGYKNGAENLLKLASYIFNKTEINYVSAFALSKNNLSRPKQIINSIKKVLSLYLDKIQKEKKEFNVKFIGNFNFLDKKLVKQITEINKIQSNKKSLIIFINYSGEEDIKLAANRSYISKDSFEKSLSTSQLPNPDMLIRTGGFNRISDFMLYQISFTELFFIKKLWPDFKVDDLKRCIQKFRNIERKFGK